MAVTAITNMLLFFIWAFTVMTIMAVTTIPMSIVIAGTCMFPIQNENHRYCVLLLRTSSKSGRGVIFYGTAIYSTKEENLLILGGYMWRTKARLLVLVGVLLMVLTGCRIWVQPVYWWEHSPTHYYHHDHRHHDHYHHY